MPLLIGLHRSLEERARRIWGEELVLVDLDNDEMQVKGWQSALYIIRDRANTGIHYLGPTFEVSVVLSIVWNVRKRS